jgi:hypothetical protein
LLALMAALGLFGLAAPAGAQPEVDIGFFYTSMAPYGNWVARPEYGWVWYPTGVPVGWRPYTDGRWVWTDEYGWMWESDREWGWAAFHYGRWDFDDHHGWYWVPDTVWGPAWVAWRHGGGYIGWAPLPPRVRWRGSLGLDWGGMGVDVAIPGRSWMFVHERHIVDPRLSYAILLPARNVTLIHHTTHITNVSISHDRVINHGVPIARLEAEVRIQVPRARVQEVSHAADARLSRASPNRVTVFRPLVKPAPATVRPPTRENPQQRQAVQAQRLAERHQAEARKLERSHQAVKPVAGKTPAQLQQERAAERQALARDHQVEQRLLDTRLLRSRPAAPAPAATRPKAKPAPPPAANPGAHPAVNPKDKPRDNPKVISRDKPKANSRSGQKAGSHP